MVGGVSGLKQIRAADDRESSVGDGLYWTYESAIKSAESDLGSITAADGEIFAMRRELFRPMDPTLINDDAALTLAIVQAGYRLVYEPTARSYEDASVTISDDFNVKVRMVSGGFQTLHRNWRFLFALQTRFTWQFLCHKTLRWIAPELLIVLFLSSATQLHQPRYAVLFWLQLAFYALALAGLFLRSGTRPLPRVLYVPFYFCAMNAAARMGLYRYVTGTTVWKKAVR
jgi:cellulose synthase/poly-beta-1,6-N-acetylglucosamine synthase-like glycosyltransferase